MLVVCNLTPTVHHGLRLGVPRPGAWVERLNTDSTHYGGSNVGTPLGQARSRRRGLRRPAAVHRHRPAAAGHGVLRMDSLTSQAALQGVTLHTGRPWPLGATGGRRRRQLRRGVRARQAVELCLFDADGRHELRRLVLPGRSSDVWHGFLPGAGAGLVYGLRAHGPWRPDRGLRFNPHKLLLDPWAREIVGRFDWGPQHLGATRSSRSTWTGATTPPGAEGACRRRPRRLAGRPRAAHAAGRQRAVRAARAGFSRLLPGVPEAQRGTYLGLASDAGIAHLQRLGITAVSLLPVHQHLDEQRLVQLGLVNHWGYNTLGFFCPSPRYATRWDGRRPATSSAPWCGGCTRPASRCCWTWSTTTPPRATNTAPHQLARAGQRQLVPPAARPPQRPTRTGAAAATPSTCTTRAACSW
jgi:hypothetical protein